MDMLVLISLISLAVIGVVFIGALAHTAEFEAQSVLIPVKNHSHKFGERSQI